MTIKVCEKAIEKVNKLETNLNHLRLCEKWCICPLCGDKLIAEYNEHGKGETQTGYKCANSCHYRLPM